MTKLRVLLVSFGYPPDEQGGTQLYGEGLAEALVRAGHEVSVFAANPRSATTVHSVEHQGPIEVERLWDPERAPDDPLALRRPDVEDRFVEALNRTKPDVVHVLHLMHLSPALVEVARDRGTPVVVGLNDHWFLCPLVNLAPGRSHHLGGRLWGVNCLWHSEATSVRRVAALALRGRLWTRARHHLSRPARMRATLGRANVLVAPSMFVRDRFVEFGARPSTIEVLPYGLEPSAGEVVGGRAAPCGRVSVGYLGIYHESKGADLLVDAFRTVDAPGARLTLRGEPLKRDYLRRLRSAAAEDPRITVGDRVPFTEMQSYLASLDLLVIPSRVHETFCRVAHEAARARLPVLASRVGALAEVVAEGRNGLLFEPDDRHDLAAKLRALVSTPGTLAALDRFPRVKTMDEHVAELVGIYRREGAGP
ncbi:MAG: glycosyltransferase [Actinomycetota bacterium]